MAEQYPTDVTLNALSGGSDGEQEVAYPTIAESPYYTSFYKMLYRLLDVARRAGDLRVFKDGDNTFGVRAGLYMNGDAPVSFQGASGQSLTNDATNYIYLTAAGTLTVNTAAFPDPSATPHLPLATIAVGNESQAQIDDEYDFVDITDYRGRGMFGVLSAATAADLNTLVDGSNADALHVHGAAGINVAQVEKMAIVHVEDLAAGVDISNRPILVHPRAVTLVSVGILTEGAPAGVDNSNTVAIDILDDASNSIVYKVYDTAAQPPTSDYEDFGALDGTHKVLAAGEHLLLLVNQGPTADMPAFSLVIRYLVDDA